MTKFEITSENLSTLVGMLSELPFKVAQPVLKHLEKSLTKVEPNVSVVNEGNENNEGHTDAGAD